MSADNLNFPVDQLQRVAVNLQKINSTLEHLVGAVEEVSITLEKNHEPEDEMGTHLVKALRDLVGAIKHEQSGRAVRHDRDFR